MIWRFFRHCRNLKEPSVYVLALAFARSRVGGVARLFKEISVFFGFLIKFWPLHHFLAFFSNWRLRKSNRWLRNMKKTLFRSFYQISAFLSFFSIFQSLAASEIEQVASKHEKKRCFWSFYQISVFSPFISHLCLQNHASSLEIALKIVSSP